MCEIISTMEWNNKKNISISLAQFSLFSSQTLSIVRYKHAIVQKSLNSEIERCFCAEKELRQNLNSEKKKLQCINS